MRRKLRINLSINLKLEDNLGAMVEQENEDNERMTLKRAFEILACCHIYHLPFSDMIVFIQ